MAEGEGWATSVHSISTAATKFSAPQDLALTPSKINQYINEGFETVYNTDPVANNYFLITHVYDPFNSSGTLNDSAIFRRYCQSITLSDNLGVQFNTDTYKARGQNYYTISSLGKNISVKIEYMEDSMRTMFHLHKNWLDAWYSTPYNCMVCGRQNKFRNMDIQFFRMTPAGPKVYSKATIINMVPSDAGHLFEANYAQPGNENKYTVTYTIDRIEFKFYEGVKAESGKEVEDSDAKGTLSLLQQAPFDSWNTDKVQLSAPAQRESSAGNRVSPPEDGEISNNEKMKRY